MNYRMKSHWDKNSTRMTRIERIYTDNIISVNQNFSRHPRSIILFFLFLISFSVFAADDFPARSKRIVTDYTNTLSAAEQNQLEQKLVAFNDSTSTQIAVVLMHSTGNYDINEYAVQLGNKWGIGQKNKNNGILILLAVDDHKVSIQTGYGMEGVAPDVLMKRIIENDMIPDFKQGNYYQGLEQGTNTLMSLVKGEYSADDYMKGSEQKFPWFVILLIFFIIVISIGVKANQTRRYARTNGLSFLAAWMLLNAATRRQRGSWGMFSGGGGFGGGGSGGGFGGFGGGGFGGGGSSGSW